MKKAALKIKNATVEHIDNILNIEKVSFTIPWTESVFRNELEKLSWSKTFMVKYYDIYAGYLLYWIIDSDCHLQKIAVLPEYRKMNIAGFMISHLFKTLKTNQISRILLEYREHNPAAASLYDKMGFSKLDIRKKYYRDTGENAIVMEKLLM